ADERLNLHTLNLPDEVRVLLERLRVHQPNSRKIRLGQANDGGYILPASVLERCSRLVSIGISNDSRFEEDWFEATGKPVSMFDGSGPCPAICQRWPSGDRTPIRFTQRHVGNTPEQVTLADAIAGPPGLLLKMDAEGAEYETIPLTDLSGCAALLLEVHDLGQPAYRTRLVDILRQIDRDFVLVHLHGNNCRTALPLPASLQGAGAGLPAVIELTFVNRRHHGPLLALDDARYPIAGLDAPNDPSLLDHDLAWVNRY
ncbi:MAG: hypothetical protein ACR2J8_10240, partial [Thermomicrobiales bacterium]